MKPGYKTTEFWAALVAVVLTDLQAIPSPPHYRPIITAALAVAYALSRGLAKLGAAGGNGRAPAPAVTDALSAISRALGGLQRPAPAPTPPPAPTPIERSAEPPPTA